MDALENETYEKKTTSECFLNTGTVIDNILTNNFSNDRTKRFHINICRHYW